MAAAEIFGSLQTWSRRCNHTVTLVYPMVFIRQLRASEAVIPAQIDIL